MLTLLLNLADIEWQSLLEISAATFFSMRYMILQLVHLECHVILWNAVLVMEPNKLLNHSEGF